MIDLTQEEIGALLSILNQIQVSGVENMAAILRIVVKLKGAAEDDSGD